MSVELQIYSLDRNKRGFKSLLFITQTREKFMVEYKGASPSSIFSRLEHIEFQTPNQVSNRYIFGFLISCEDGKDHICGSIIPTTSLQLLCQTVLSFRQLKMFFQVCSCLIQSAEFFSMDASGTGNYQNIADQLVETPSNSIWFLLILSEFFGVTKVFIECKTKLLRLINLDGTLPSSCTAGLAEEDVLTLELNVKKYFTRYTLEQQSTKHTTDTSIYSKGVETSGLDDLREDLDLEMNTDSSIASSTQHDFFDSTAPNGPPHNRAFSLYQQTGFYTDEQYIPMSLEGKDWSTRRRAYSYSVDHHHTQSFTASLHYPEERDVGLTGVNEDRSSSNVTDTSDLSWLHNTPPEERLPAAQPKRREYKLLEGLSSPSPAHSVSVSESSEDQALSRQYVMEPYEDEWGEVRAVPSPSQLADVLEQYERRTLGDVYLSSRVEYHGQEQRGRKSWQPPSHSPAFGSKTPRPVLSSSSSKAVKKPSVTLAAGTSHEKKVYGVRDPGSAVRRSLSTPKRRQQKREIIDFGVYSEPSAKARNLTPVDLRISREIAALRLKETRVRGELEWSRQQAQKALRESQLKSLELKTAALRITSSKRGDGRGLRRVKSAGLDRGRTEFRSFVSESWDHGGGVSEQQRVLTEKEARQRAAERIQLKMKTDKQRSEVALSKEKEKQDQKWVERDIKIARFKQRQKEKGLTDKTDLDSPHLTKPGIPETFLIPDQETLNPLKTPSKPNHHKFPPKPEIFNSLEDKHVSSVVREGRYTKEALQAVGLGLSPSGGGMLETGDDCKKENINTDARKQEEEVITVRVIRAWDLVDCLGGTNAYVVLDWGRHGRAATQSVRDNTAPHFGATLRFKSPYVLLQNVDMGDEQSVELTHLFNRGMLEQIGQEHGGNVLFDSNEKSLFISYAGPMALQVYSRNSSVSDEMLGWVEVDVHAAVVGRRTEVLHLVNPQNRGKSAGAIEIKVTRSII